MKKAHFASFVLLLAVAAAIVVLPALSRSRREPVFEGKRLSAWLRDLDSFSDDGKRAKAHEALLALGTNSLAPLPNMLRARDYIPSRVLVSLNKFGAKHHFHITMAIDVHLRALAAYGFLGQLARSHVSVLADMLAKEASPELRARAARALHCIHPMGDEAAGAIPALVAGARDRDAELRFRSVFALVVIRPAPDLLLPVLIESLNDPVSGTREVARMGLLSVGEAAIPALQKAGETNQLANQVLRELQGRRLERRRPRGPLSTPPSPVAAEVPRAFLAAYRMDCLSRLKWAGGGVYDAPMFVGEVGVVPASGPGLGST